MDYGNRIPFTVTAKKVLYEDRGVMLVEITRLSPDRGETKLAKNFKGEWWCKTAIGYYCLYTQVPARI